MPEISIIIPNYNTRKYLPRCLDSLTQQTFGNIEVILIDDGSTDGSVEIMKEYAQKDSRIKIIEQINSGPAKARNKGLENASGKYLMFCDSDDWYEPDMCEMMYTAIEKNNVDIVCCHNFFDLEESLSDEEKEKRLPRKYFNKSGKYSLNQKNILTTDVVLWNKIWRRDLIEKYNIRFPEGHEHDDDAFWYMYSFVSKKIFFLNKKLYHYFLRAGSIMSTQVNKKPKNRLDRIAISYYIFDFLTKNNLYNNNKQIMAHIFRKEVKCARFFFSFSELEEICCQINKKISPYRLSVKKNGKVSVKKKLFNLFF